MTAQIIERYQAADRHAAGAARRHLIKTFDRLEIDEHVRRHDPLFHERKQVASAADEGAVFAVFVRLLHQRDGLLEITGISIGKCFHASTPRILSRVIGRSFIRRPIALKTALATAATAGTLLDSPMLFAPYGPYPSSLSMNITSISGTSR